MSSELSKERIGVLDVGSSAVKYAVYRVSPGITPELIREGDPVATSLGRGLVAGGPLDPAARARTREVIREFTAAILDLDAHPALLLATEAVRRTRDREAFLAELRDDTRGLADVRCIGFEEEARWSFESARAGLGPLGGDTLVVDPGGSSNDFALGDDSGARHLFTLSFGMNDFMDVVDPRADDGRVTPDDIARLREAGLSRYSALREQLDPLPGRLIAGSGAAISLGAVGLALTAGDRESRARAAHGVAVSRPHLHQLIDTLAPLSSSQRRALHPCISESRAPIFVHGAVVYDAMLEVLELEEMTVNGMGIKLGAAMDIGNRSE